MLSSGHQLKALFQHSVFCNCILCFLEFLWLNYYWVLFLVLQVSAEFLLCLSIIIFLNYFYFLENIILNFTFLPDPGLLLIVPVFLSFFYTRYIVVLDKPLIFLLQASASERLASKNDFSKLLISFSLKFEASLSSWVWLEPWSDWTSEPL